MNKLQTISILVLSVIITVGVLSPAVAYTETELQDRIAVLEKVLDERNLIIMEQIKVIMDLKDSIPKTYEPFNEIKFPQTEGHDPEWLEDKKESILDTCSRAQADGYTISLCKFVQ